MFAIEKDIHCTSVTSNNSYSNITTVGSYPQSLITPDLGTNGTIVYDTTNHVFKLKKNNVWSSISTGSGSSGSSGAVQLSDGNGNFSDNEKLYVQDGLVFDNSDIGSDKPFVLALKSGVNQQYPSGGSGDPGDVFYGDIGGTTTFWGYKGNSWYDLSAGGSGGTVSVNAPERSLQFADSATTQLSSSPLARFWLAGDTPLTGLTLQYNAFTIGNIFQTSTPTTSTIFAYSSDATNKTIVQFDESSGVNIGLNDTAVASGNGEFRVETKEAGASAIGEDKIILQTWDGNTKINTYRRSNGPEYGQGSISLLTNTGGITLQSRGENSGAGVPTGPNGGPINIIGNDADINMETTAPFSTPAGTNKKINLSCIGSRTFTTNTGIRLETKRQSGAGSTSSNNIELSTVGGDVTIETTGAGGSAITGKISLNSGGTNGIEMDSGVDIDMDAGVDIDMNAGVDINLNAPSGSIKAKSKLELQTSASATTIDLDGSSDGIVTVGTTSNYNGNIKAINTQSGTGTAGYAVRIGSDPTNESGRIQLTNNSDQVTMDINGADDTGNSQPYIRLGDFIGTGSGKDLYIRSLQNNKACIEGITSQNTMIIESNGGTSTGSAEHGQMIFSSAGNTSGSIPVMKIERSDLNDDSTATLQLERPLRLWNATTSNITNSTKGLTQPGDLGFDITEDCVKYRSNNGNILCLASGDQRILRVVQGSESLAKNYNASAAATSWSSVVAPAPAIPSGTVSGPAPLGPAGPPSIIGTIRSGTTFTNASQATPITPAIQSAPGSGTEDCNIIYLGTGGSQPGNIIPADGTPNFRPVLCCKCMVPERISADPADLEYSLLVSGNLNIWAKLSTSSTGSDKINFSLGVFATLADSIGMPNGGVGAGTSTSERRNNPYTLAPNNGGAAGTTYSATYVSVINGTDTTIPGTGGGMGGVGTWPRPLHSSYYTNLTQPQTTVTPPGTGTGNTYRYQSIGTFTNGTWTDPLGFQAGAVASQQPANSGWGDALKGDPYQETPTGSQRFWTVEGGSGTITVPFNLLCNNPNLDRTNGTWSKGPEREIYLWLCLGFNAGGNWDWLQVAKNGFGNSGNPDANVDPFFGANSMKVTYLGADAATSSGASSDA